MESLASEMYRTLKRKYTISKWCNVLLLTALALIFLAGELGH